MTVRRFAVVTTAALAVDVAAPAQAYTQPVGGGPECYQLYNAAWVFTELGEDPETAGRYAEAIYLECLDLKNRRP